MICYRSDNSEKDPIDPSTHIRLYTDLKKSCSLLLIQKSIYLTLVNRTYRERILHADFESISTCSSDLSTLLVEKKKLTKNTLNEHIHDRTVYIQFICTYILDVSQCFNTAYGARVRVWVYSTSTKSFLRHEKETYEVCIRHLMDTTTKPNYSVFYIL